MENKKPIYLWVIDGGELTSKLKYELRVSNLEMQSVRAEL